MKIALIMGGTRGIGYEIAKKLKNYGYVVCVTYLNSENKAQQMKSEGFMCYKADYSKYEDLNFVYNDICKNFGKIDIVVNNVGISYGQKLLLDTSVDEIRNVIDTNLIGCINSTKLAISKMINDVGLIINISSIWGVESASCESVYSASKGGVIAFTKSIAEEMLFSKIKICCICPGIVDTEMNSHLSKDDIDNFINCNKKRYFVKPEEIAQLVCDIIKKPKSRVNGRCFKIGC